MSSNENTSTSATAATASSTTSDTESSNSTTTFNPLLRVVFIAKVLRFLQQDYIMISMLPFFDEPTTTKVKSIPRLLQLRTVHSSWSDTIAKSSSIPSSVVSRFCKHLDNKYLDFLRRTKTGNNSEDNSCEKYSMLLNIRDAFMQIGHFVKDRDSVESYCLLLKKFLTPHNTNSSFHVYRSRVNAELFSTDILRDVLIEMSDFTATTAAVRHHSASSGCWCSVIELLTNKQVCGRDFAFSNAIFGNVIFKQQSVPENPVENPIIESFPDNRILLGGEEICRCFIKIFNTTSWMLGFSIKSWCKAIANITSLEENREVYATKEFSETMCSVAAKLIVENSYSSYSGGSNSSGVSSNSATDGGNPFLEILLNLTENNNSMKKLLAVAVIRDVMLKLSNIFVKGSESCLCWSNVFLILSQENPQLFCINETPPAIVRIANTRNLFNDACHCSRECLRCFRVVVDLVKQQLKCAEIFVRVDAKLKSVFFPIDTILEKVEYPSASHFAKLAEEALILSNFSVSVEAHDDCFSTSNTFAIQQRNLQNAPPNSAKQKQQREESKAFSWGKFNLHPKLHTLQQDQQQIPNFVKQRRLQQQKEEEEVQQIVSVIKEQQQHQKQEEERKQTLHLMQHIEANIEGAEDFFL